MQKLRLPSILCSLLLGFFFQVGVALAEEDFWLEPYVVKGDPSLAGKVDRLMIGVQHWYADQFAGRTFKVRPTQVVNGEKDAAGGPVNKGKLQLFFNDSYGSGAGLGYVGNRTDGAGRAYVGKAAVDSILKHDSYWEGPAWNAIVHEMGHALGLDHSGRTFMNPVSGPLSPYDHGQNANSSATDAQRKLLENNKFLDAANNPNLNHQQVKDAINGKISPDQIHKWFDPAGTNTPPTPSPEPGPNPAPGPSPGPSPGPTPPGPPPVPPSPPAPPTDKNGLKPNGTAKNIPSGPLKGSGRSNPNYKGNINLGASKNVPKPPHPPGKAGNSTKVNQPHKPHSPGK